MNCPVHHNLTLLPILQYCLEISRRWGRGGGWGRRRRDRTHFLYWHFMVSLRWRFSVPSPSYGCLCICLLQGWGHWSDDVINLNLMSARISPFHLYTRWILYEIYWIELICCRITWHSWCWYYLLEYLFRLTTTIIPFPPYLSNSDPYSFYCSPHQCLSFITNSHALLLSLSLCLPLSHSFIPLWFIRSCPQTKK